MTNFENQEYVKKIDNKKDEDTFEINVDAIIDKILMEYDFDEITSLQEKIYSKNDEIGEIIDKIANLPLFDRGEIDVSKSEIDDFIENKVLELNNLITTFITLGTKDLNILINSIEDLNETKLSEELKKFVKKENEPFLTKLFEKETDVGGVLEKYRNIRNEALLEN